MKTKAVMITVLWMFFACATNAQNIETKTYKTIDITTVAVSGNVDMHLTQGNETTVKVEATPEQYQKMQINITDNQVSVFCKNGSPMEKPIKVHVSVLNLTTLAASAGAAVMVENKIETKTLTLALSSGSDFSGAIDADNVTFALSSGSDVDMKDSKINVLKLVTSSGSDYKANNLEVKTLKVVISGGSDVDLSGTVNDFNLVASGGSDCAANNLKSQNCNVAVSGGSEVNIHVTNELSIAASGGSDIRCKGNPTVVKQDISKTCDFKLE